MSNRLVLKYGGSSVGSIELIKKVAEVIKKRVELGYQVCVVASAMGNTTDKLMEMASALTANIDRRELDNLLSTGEQQTVSLLAMSLQDIGIDAISLTGFQAGFKTTRYHTKSRIIDVDTSRIEKHLQEGKVVIVAGFQGISEDGNITTLGRGGSDTSAVALAVKLSCDCYIYTDVEAVCTTDPKIYHQAKKIHVISYQEMMELATLGAGVLDPRSVELASKYNVKLYLGKSLEENHERGTMIVDESILLERKSVVGVTTIDNISIMSFEGIDNDPSVVANIFRLVSDNNINIDMISQNYDEQGKLIVSFSLNSKDLGYVKEIVSVNETLFNKVRIESSQDLTKLSIVGIGMKNHFGVAAEFFETLAKHSINFYQVTTSEISISCSIDKHNKEKAVKAIARRFGL